MLATIKKNNMPFLSRENIHSALWALVIAFLGFIGELIWKNYSGPEKVIVERVESNGANDTTITVVRFEGDSATIEALKKYKPKLSVKSTNNTDLRNVALLANPRKKCQTLLKTIQ